MKKYECLYIVNMNFDSEGVSAVTARVEAVLKNVGGKLANSQHWGKRKLAYAIDKERYGNYILLHFEGEKPNVTEFHRELEIESGVLHYMTIRLDEFPDFETLSVPQAYEADRRRSSAPGGQRPRRYDQSAPREAAATEKPAAAEQKADDSSAPEPAAEAAETKEAPAEKIEVVEAAEEAKPAETETEKVEVVEAAEEAKPAETETEKVAVVEATEEAKPADDVVEESAVEAVEEDAEKPANAE